MSGASRLGPAGWALVEVIVTLTVLSVGLLATAGLVRAVSRQIDQARAESDAALQAQQLLEAALSARAPPPHSGEDTLALGGRNYIVRMDVEVETPTLERIRVDVVRAGPPGFGTGLPRPRSYGTRRRSPLPRLLPPEDEIR